MKKQTDQSTRVMVTGQRDRMINDTADRVDKLEIRVRCLMFAVAMMMVYMLAMTAIGGMWG